MTMPEVLGTIRAYIIFVIFSPHGTFLATIFLHTKKRVNRDKTDFAVKQRKPLIN